MVWKVQDSENLINTMVLKVDRNLINQMVWRVGCPKPELKAKHEPKPKAMVWKV